MKVLLTGGAGYIGTELVDLLVADEKVKEIRIYDNLSRNNFNFFLGNKLGGGAKIKFIRAELLDSRTLKKSLEDIDVVYHLAAKVTTPFANDDPHLYEQVNHWGTAELVYAIENAEVSKVIYTSSSGVYGSSSEAVDENVQPQPKTFYAISKLRAEEHVQRLATKKQVFILRCGNVYGYNRSMRFDAVINKFVFEAHFNKRITVHGDGRQSRSFIHIGLAAKALHQLLYSDVTTGTYNLVERSIKVIDVVDELKSLIPELEFIFINQHLKLAELNVKENGEFNKQLGISSHLTLREELQQFLRAFSF
jgi:UDP-glucose 4-epimerase